MEEPDEAAPEELAPEALYEEEDVETPDEAADEEEEVVVDEVTSDVVKLYPGIEMVPTSQVIPPSLVLMLASTSVPRERVSMYDSSAAFRVMETFVQVCAPTVPQSEAPHSTAEPHPSALPSLVESVETTLPPTMTFWV